ncbi:(2Fe-2S)-binding protein [Actinopolymorpha singaporensis]|uniref:(2Fe-2S)-binding protein n=1 Tax=Actinopolymorpha singaporensis TaxID=117157 RepID=UPI0012FD182B|nr:(2Fe-2S)-binding protein [Actinopolymorpha singaporensis]
MSGAGAGELLAEAGTVGAYFAVSTEVPRELPGDRELVSLAQLYAGHAALGQAITHTTDRLGTTEPRVGASILFQGMAARLWSPVVAVALLRRRVPVLAPGTTWPDLGASGRPWRTDPARVVLLAPDGQRDVDASGHLHNDLVHLARLAVRTVVKTHLTPLKDAVRAEASLPDALLWGNAASALVGTLGVLAGARPELTREVAAFTETALRQPPLADAGIVDPPTPSAGGVSTSAFVRRSCCLYYRVPGGGLCGDCPLAR